MSHRAPKAGTRAPLQPPAASAPRQSTDKRKPVVKAIKAVLGKLEAAQIPEDDNGGVPSPLDNFLARLAHKSPNALDYHLLSQSLVPWWSDWDVQEIEVVPSDLTPSVVEILADLFRLVLKKGYGVGVVDKDELVMDDLVAMKEWVDKVWEAVESLLPENEPEPAPHLASPKLSRQEAAPAPQAKKQRTKKTTRVKEEPAPKYRAIPVPKDASPDLLGGPPTPAQSGAEKVPAPRKQQAVPSVEIAVKPTNRKRKIESSSVEFEKETEREESPATSRRRSGRQPSHRSPPVSALVRRYYPLYSVLMVKLEEDVEWPAAIVDESNEEGLKIHGEYHDGDYLVQLLPTRKQLWISPNDMSPLPPKNKHHVPAGLKKQKRIAEYELAIDLLHNDRALDRWLNNVSLDELFSDAEQESRGEGRQSGTKVRSSAKKSRKG